MDEIPEVFVFKGQKFLYKGLGQIWPDWGISEVFLFKGQIGTEGFLLGPIRVRSQSFLFKGQICPLKCF